MELFNGRLNDFMRIDHLRSFESIPHWFGLGFIQLKLTDSTRMHFWHPDLQADTPEEELHDHRYQFSSHILVGEITHEEWLFDQVTTGLGDHEIVQVSCKPGDATVPISLMQGFLKQGSTYHMSAGSRYTFIDTAFHRIRATRAITYLERGTIVKDYANVIRPIGAASVCPFEKKINPSRLWEFIEDLLPANDGLTRSVDANPGYHLADIPKGVLGEPSKILEEVLEFIDAVNQGADIMGLVELSDLQGAVQAYLKKYHSSLGMEDLIKMSNITERAFRNGRR